MNRRDAKILRQMRRLKRATDDAGWIGGGGNSLHGGLACLVSDGSFISGEGPSKRFSATQAGLGPAVVSINSEERVFIAFGRDASGMSIPFHFDYDEIWFTLGSLIDFNMTYEQTASVPIINLPGIGDGKYYIQFPQFLVVYPILDPWKVVFLGESGYPISWANQPNTTFSANLAAGSVTGFDNPATNFIDNALSITKCGFLRHIIGNVTLSAGSSFPIEVQISGAAYDDPERYGHWGDILPVPPGGTLMQYPRFTRAMRTKTEVNPKGTIYGLGLYILTIADLFAIEQALYAPAGQCFSAPSPPIGMCGFIMPALGVLACNINVMDCNVTQILTAYASDGANAPGDIPGRENPYYPFSYERPGTWKQSPYLPVHRFMGVPDDADKDLEGNYKTLFLDIVTA